MFRRRPILRRRILRQAAILEPGPRQMLIQANQLKDSGRYTEAADIFERLARGAERRGILDRAPHLYLQAAHCRLLANQGKPGVELMWQGLHLLEKTRRWRMLYASGKAAVEELKHLDQNEAAEKLQAWLDQILQEHPEAAAPPPELADQKRPPRLPTKCPSCGASVRPDQVEWIDQITVECQYCGSAIQAEE